MPSAPCVTARTAAVFVTIVNVTSLASVTARGLSAHLRPLSISHCAFSRVRFQPVTLWPAWSNRFATPPPITPRPTKPISATPLPLLGSADVALHARDVLLHPLTRILRTLACDRLENQAVQLD